MRETIEEVREKERRKSDLSISRNVEELSSGKNSRKRQDDLRLLRIP